MSEISYVNTVNVNLNSLPQGLSEFAVANICLFSNEKAGFADDYKVYVEPATVATDFGSNSITAKMANAIFAQSPNLRSGKGSLIVAPYVATSATSGFVTTTDLTSNLASFRAVTNGQLSLKIDGKATTLYKLDFSGVKTVKDIATVIANKNSDMFVEVVDQSKIKFSSKLVGENSTIEFVVATGDGVDVGSASYLNVVALSSTAGSNASDVEALSEAVNRIAEKVFFGVVLDTCMRENESIENNAQVIEALSKKLYMEVTGSLNNIAVLGKAIKEGGYKKTRIVAYSSDSLVEAKRFLGGYASKAVSTNYGGSNTCMTMNLKEIATIAPDANCSNGVFQDAKTNGVDIYGNTGGLGCVYSFKNAGGYTDDQTGIMALVGDLEVAAFNYLRQTNTKIPQTEQGVTGIKNVCAKVCEKYVNNGFIGTGLTWNSAQKFGNAEDFDRNIADNGYYVYSEPIAKQAQGEREERIAPLIQIAVKTAGAIHIVNINGTIES